MLLKENVTDQKLRGAYYTPQKLSDFIVNVFANDIRKGNIKNILEPSCGDGIFLKSLIENDLIKDFNRIIAVEIDGNESKKADNLVKDFNNVVIENKDFIKYYKELLNTKKFDLILGNPPYIRYQYLTEFQKEFQSKILIDSGMKPNKLINAWVFFIVASINLLSEGGKLGLVIPAEILQVKYAEDLRLFLSKTLSEITILTFNELMFEGIEQEVVVLIGKKKNELDDVCNIGVKQFEGLQDLSMDEFKNIKYKELECTKEKWTKYFIDNNMDLISIIEQDQRFRRFDEVGKINVGITTGNNDYFCVNKDIVEEYNLNDVVLPLIGRSSHAHGIYFTDEDWNSNIRNGKNAFLITFSNDKPIEEYEEKHIEYIKYGEETDQNTGYKCKIRKRWYVVPSIWIPDAFILRRNHTFPKFVINNIDAVSTDTMHRIKFKEGINQDKILLSYYNSITFAYTEIKGRSYGGGVLEILPKEISSVMLPNIDEFDDNMSQELLQMVDDTIRNDLDIEEMLDIIDKEVLVNYLGIDEEICKKFRLIWKDLMNRRNTRSN